VRLLLLRHGQTTCNVTGALDTAFPGAVLTDLGERQAAAVPDALAGEAVAAVHASPLTRAGSTAAPLAVARGFAVRVHDGLEEIAAGDLELRTDDAAVRTYADTVSAWMHGDLDRVMPGGQDGRSFLGRYDAAMAGALAGHPPDATVVVVSHGAAIRAWSSLRGGVPAAQMDEMHLRNTGMAVLDGHPTTGWSLVEWRSEPVGGAHLLDDEARDVTGDSADEVREAG
jgi:broad specificity phosphatase PhoE